ncbi:DUF3047 domain-containing protein [Hydrogenophaga sp. 5NK40-0174]|uniref:DUF3047 domain-containing protein n=1 Tax=Hydrogenophaga sp. 5NK40-0174 TaxID=3127649 RepID=UPI0031075C14
MKPFRSLFPAWVLMALASANVQAQTAATQPRLVPVTSAGIGQLPPPWAYQGLPDQEKKSIPPSDIAVADLEGQPALRLLTNASYGTLIHPWQGPPEGRRLRWQWRLDKPLSGGKAPPDLKTKPGDDAALKVCVMFDQPLDRMSFGERTLLRFARSVSGKELPAATLCYIWDSTYAAGLRGENPYSRRVRYVVAKGKSAPVGTWQPEERDIEADFRERFADELPPDGEPLPPISHIAVGADSDNTGSQSLGWIKQLQWATVPAPEAPR